MKEMNITPDNISDSEEVAVKSDFVPNEIPIIVQSKKSQPITGKIPAHFSEYITQISEQEAILLGANFKPLKEKIPISELRNTIIETNDVEVVIFDGIITQRLLDIVYERGVKTIIGARQHDITKKPAKIDLYTFSE